MVSSCMKELKAGGNDKRERKSRLPQTSKVSNSCRVSAFRSLGAAARRIWASESEVRSCGTAPNCMKGWGLVEQTLLHSEKSLPLTVYEKTKD